MNKLFRTALAFSLLMSLFILPISAKKVSFSDLTVLESLDPNSTARLQIRSNDATNGVRTMSNRTTGKLRLRLTNSSELNLTADPRSTFTVRVFRINDDGTETFLTSSSHRFNRIRRNSANSRLAMDVPFTDEQGNALQSQKLKFVLYNSQFNRVPGSYVADVFSNKEILTQQASQREFLTADQKQLFSEEQLTFLMQYLAERVMVSPSRISSLQGAVKLLPNNTLNLVIPTRATRITKNRRTKLLRNEVIIDDGLASAGAARTFVGTLAERDQRDNEPQGTLYLATDTNDFFIKQSNDAGDWARFEGIVGPQGPSGSPGGVVFSQPAAAPTTTTTTTTTTAPAVTVTGCNGTDTNNVGQAAGTPYVCDNGTVTIPANTNAFDPNVVTLTVGGIANLRASQVEIIDPNVSGSDSLKINLDASGQPVSFQLVGGAVTNFNIAGPVPPVNQANSLLVTGRNYRVWIDVTNNKVMLQQVEAFAGLGVTSTKQLRLKTSGTNI